MVRASCDRGCFITICCKIVFSDHFVSEDGHNAAKTSFATLLTPFVSAGLLTSGLGRGIGLDWIGLYKSCCTMLCWMSISAYLCRRWRLFCLVLFLALEYQVQWRDNHRHLWIRRYCLSNFEKRGRNYLLVWCVWSGAYFEPGFASLQICFVCCICLTPSSLQLRNWWVSRELAFYTSCLFVCIRSEEIFRMGKNRLSQCRNRYVCVVARLPSSLQKRCATSE